MKLLFSVRYVNRNQFVTISALEEDNMLCVCSLYYRLKTQHSSITKTFWHLRLSSCSLKDSTKPLSALHQQLLESPFLLTQQWKPMCAPNCDTTENAVRASSNAVGCHSPSILAHQYWSLNAASHQVTITVVACLFSHLVSPPLDC